MKKILPVGALGSLMTVLAAGVSAQTTVETVADALREFADTPTRAAAGDYVGRVCANGVFSQTTAIGIDAQARCNAIAAAVLEGDADDRSLALQALGAIANDEHPSTRAAWEQMGATGARLAAETGGLGIQIVDNAFGTFSWSSQAAGDGDGPWNVFINGLYVKTKQDTSTLEVGFDADDFGVMIGADYELSESFVLGAAFDYRTSRAAINNSGGSLETDTFGLYGFASFYPGANWVVDGMLFYSDGNHAQERNVVYTEPGAAPPTASVNLLMTSETDSDDFGFSLSVGHNFQHETLVWTPYARLDYVDSQIGAFTEESSSSGFGGFVALGTGLALNVEEQDFESLTTSFGVMLSGQVSGGFLGTLYPYASVEYTHEFENDNEPLTAKFVADPVSSGFALALPIEPPDRNYFSFGVGATATITEQTSGFLRYQGLFLYRDLSVHAIELGIRHAF